MTLEEIVQKRYELEMNSLSPLARRVVSRNFSNYSSLMVFHKHGPYAFRRVTSSENVKVELFDLSKRIFKIFQQEQLVEWKNVLTQDSSIKDEQLEKIVDNYLNQAYLLILNEEGQFVQVTIKNNCPHYTQALQFIEKKKSVYDFLRCSDNERKELAAFFEKFSSIYNDIMSLYTQKEKVSKEKKNEGGKVIQNKKDSHKPAKSHKKNSSNKSSKNNKKTTRIRTVENSKQHKDKDENNATYHDSYFDHIKKDDNANTQDIKLAYAPKLSESFKYPLAPSFYDTPVFHFDDLTMLASINYGCNGITSFGLSSKFVAPSFNVLYNFERENNKYDPDIAYRKPIVSDRISRSSHRYKWFGVNGMDCLDSFRKYGIVAKCLDLYFGEYKCYVPVETDENNGLLYAAIETSDDLIISYLLRRKDLKDFLISEDISLRDFKLMEITDKLHYLCNFYDIYDFLELDEDLYEKNDIVLELQAAKSKKTLDKYIWDSYSLEQKNDFLKLRLTALRNKEAFLRFNIVKINYLPFTKEMEILYEDETQLSYCHVKVDSYDDQFIYFQGKIRIKSEKDYTTIKMIRLTCTDE